MLTNGPLGEVSYGSHSGMPSTPPFSDLNGAKNGDFGPRLAPTNYLWPNRRTSADA
jgi:hypothetical protein